jgi:L-ascorbate metabolism protein UlaG (beta-lactamase superfamily)
MSWRSITDFLKHSKLVLRLADRLGRGTGRWRVLDHLSRPPMPRLRPSWDRWERHELAAVWLGHATVLLRVGGKTILTDPVFSHAVGLDLGLITAGPRRLIAPPVDLHRLPRLDLILISHAHFDHLDRPTLRRLPKSTPVITASETADLIVDLGFKDVTELQWSQRRQLGELSIQALPARHWGARTFLDTHRGFNAYVLEAGARRVLYAGDTAWHEEFRGIGPFDLGIMGIGGYDPYIQGHANPEQAWTMSRHAGARHVLPIHHSTFRLSAEPVAEPLARFRAAAAGQAHRLVGERIGQIWVADACVRNRWPDPLVG